MSKISGKDTKPEILLRKKLFSEGFRYRKNVKLLPGKPDIVLKKYNAVIFVNGCFWHGHNGCKKSKLPKTRKDFWKNKIKNTIIRDKSNIFQLEKLGYRVAIVWECSIKNKKIIEKTIPILTRWIRSQDPYIEIPT